MAELNTRGRPRLAEKSPEDVAADLRRVDPLERRLHRGLAAGGRASAAAAGLVAARDAVGGRHDRLVTARERVLAVAALREDADVFVPQSRETARRAEALVVGT
jgi:hypothetical protein